MARYIPGLKTRDRILDATRTVLGRVGIEGATVSAILERAGVRSGSFYNLFESKDEVILTVVSEAIAAVDPHPDAPEADTVDELVDAYIKFITESPAVAKIYLQIAVTGSIKDEHLSGRVLRHHRTRLERFRDAFVREGKTPGAADASAALLLAALNGLALQTIIDPDLDFPLRAKEALARLR